MSSSAALSESGCCSARRRRAAASSAARVACGQAAGQVGHQHEELVAALSPDDVARAAGPAQALGDGGQELVAGLVPEAVVDELEVVEVDVEDGERSPAVLHVRDRGVEPASELVAVGQAGQRIVIGAVGELLLGTLAVADVVDHALGERATPLDLRQDDRVVDHPALDAVRRSDAILGAKRLLRLHRGDERLLDAIAIVGMNRPEPGVGASPSTPRA